MMRGRRGKITGRGEEMDDCIGRLIEVGRVRAKGKGSKVEC